MTVGDPGHRYGSGDDDARSSAPTDAASDAPSVDRPVPTADSTQPPAGDPSEASTEHVAHDPAADHEVADHEVADHEVADHEVAEPAAAPARAPGDHKPRLSFWQELPILVAVAVGLAVLIKSFLFQAFFIPSGSMEKTLHGCPGCQGDRVMVNKLVYHLRSIKRGDIVVFNGKDNYNDVAEPVSEPSNPVSRGLHDVADFIGLTPKGTDYIKRVIGLPGDTVACCNAQGQVTVNGKGLNEPYIFVDPGMTDTNKTFGPVTVPKGRLWVMGDHRNESEDSRLIDPQTVPESDVVGRAFVIIWPPSRWRWLSNPSYGPIPAAADAAPMIVAAAVVAGASGLRRRRRRRRGAVAQAAAR